MFLKNSNEMIFNIISQLLIQNAKKALYMISIMYHSFVIIHLRLVHDILNNFLKAQSDLLFEMSSR